MLWCSKGILAQDPNDQANSLWNMEKPAVFQAFQTISKWLNVKTEGAVNVQSDLMTLLFSTCRCYSISLSLQADL